MSWEKLYQERTLTAEQMVEQHIPDGSQVFAGGLTTAGDSIRALLAAVRSGKRRGIVLHGNMLLGDLNFDDPSFNEDTFRYRCFFGGPNERKGAKTGVTFVPVHFNNYGRYMDSMQLDVAVVPMTPPDEKGFCNIGPLGPNPAGIRSCRKIVAQITPQLTRVRGSAHDHHVSEIAAFVMGDEPVATIPSLPASPEDEKIASYIVDMIPDGACFQLGIGGLANAVGYGLRSKKNLGIHSEMYTESMAVLQEAGVVDNSRKSLFPGISVGGFSLGSQKLYDYIENNPRVYFTPYEYVNDIRNIAANDNMISVNNALSIDLTGQICAESIGPRQYSGSGGQVDYIRGATLSKGGKSFIAVNSTAKTPDGVKSRITPFLIPGSVVTSLRAEVQYIVTEFGCVELRHCDIPTRAKRLISIAHPDFRDELTFEAKKMGYLY